MFIKYTFFPGFFLRIGDFSKDMLSITQDPNRLFTEYFWQLAPALMDKFGFAAFLTPFYIEVSRMFFKLKHNCILCSKEGLGEHSSNSA